MNRPIEYPNWTDGDPLKVVAPPGSFRLEGWDPGQAPPAQYMNWLFWLLNQWVMYFDTLTNAGVPDQSIRLINGGEWSFVASTDMLAWSSNANISMPGLPDADNLILADNVTLLDGQIAYVDANEPTFSKGSTQSGLNQIFNMNFTGSIAIGQSVSGPGIPPGTLVTGVFPDNVSINNNATGNNTDQTYVFGNTSNLTVQVIDNTDFVPELASLVIARRVGKKVYLGLNGTQMTLLDGEFKPLSETGYLQTFAPLAGENLSAGEAVYVSPGAGDGGRTIGRVYKLDCSAGNIQRSVFVGFVATTTLSGQAVQLVFSGFFSGSGLTVGSIYYGDPAVPGGIITPRPTSSGASIVPVGIAIDANTLLLTNAEGIPAAPQNQSVLFDEIIGFGNGIQTVFSLSNSPFDQDAVLIFINGVKIDKGQWSLAGLNITFTGLVPAVGSQIEAQYVEATTLSLALKQEPNPDTTDRQTFTLAGQPTNPSAVMVYIDGIKQDPSSFNLTLGPGPATLFLISGPLSPGQTIDVDYFTSTGQAGGGGGLTGGTNLGSGAAVFAGLSGPNSQYKTIVAFDASVTITQDANQIYIKSNGIGSYTRQTFGTFSVPVAIDPTVGIVPSADMDQTWWVKGNAPGAQPISSTPQIQPGTAVGQRLTLKGVSSSDYLTIADGNGTSQNGSVAITDNQAICYEWDGTQWSEDFRRF